MRKTGVILLIAGCTGLLIMLALTDKPPTNHGDNRLAALTQTYIAVDTGAPVQVPRLITSHGDILAPERLTGRWTVLFFGFTNCPQVCPRTLSVLGAVVRDPDSGVASGNTQLMFVSVDPEHDTPQRMGAYLQLFSDHILGLTGGRDAIDRFSGEIGAGSQAVGSSIDHSTSLFVLDPKGRLAGMLLRPNDPARIVADLKILRRSQQH
jgi:protein SCO1/2